MSTSFQIDHVELFVPNPYKAAAWYEEILGLSILKEHEHWAAEGGPLMISGDGGHTMLALFKGEPQGKTAVVGWRRVAFRVDGIQFLQFARRLDDVELNDRSGVRLTPTSIEDHDKAWSIYFADPYGNPLEVTTYDYDVVAAQQGTPLAR